MHPQQGRWGQDRPAPRGGALGRSAQGRLAGTESPAESASLCGPQGRTLRRERPQSQTGVFWEQGKRDLGLSLTTAVVRCATKCKPAGSKAFRFNFQNTMSAHKSGPDPAMLAKPLHHLHQ